MKIRTTQKEIKNSYKKIISINFCKLQCLLQFIEPTAYTSSRSGWGCDIYIIDNIVIATGYSPFGNIHPNYNICEKYDVAAEKIIYDSHLSWEEQKEKVNRLLKKFIEEVTKWS